MAYLWKKCAYYNPLLGSQLSHVLSTNSYLSLQIQKWDSISKYKLAEVVIYYVLWCSSFNSQLKPYQKIIDYMQYFKIIKKNFFRRSVSRLWSQLLKKWMKEMRTWGPTSFFPCLRWTTCIFKNHKKNYSQTVLISVCRICDIL